MRCQIFILQFFLASSLFVTKCVELRRSFGIFDRAGFGTVTFRRDSMAATLFAVQNDDRCLDACLTHISSDDYYNVRCVLSHSRDLTFLQKYARPRE